ncbi:hypothetical protein QQF64_035128 [Cirrhinus molitorella]|uniref:Uncharacterized protein n=1 Tax=Cirrhinus molitorella TaxID=172907 RepID=A0ABR3NEX2_9TELE
MPLFQHRLENGSLCSLITDIQTVKCSCLASCLSAVEGQSVSTSCRACLSVCLPSSPVPRILTCVSIYRSHAHMRIDVLSGHRDSHQQKCCAHLRHIMSNAEITVAVDADLA